MSWRHHRWRHFHGPMRDSADARGSDPRTRWAGAMPWGFWRRVDPEVRERIVREISQAYAGGFGRRLPWDRVLAEALGRRPGWHQRIRWELRLHYGSRLHRRLFLWFGAAIFVAVATTVLAAHFGRAGLGAHPWRALFLFGVPALLLWTAAGRIARRISRPLYELTRAAQDLGDGKLSARASLDRLGLDEIAVLSYAFNDMAARLERQLADQRELLAAVSHELRTPLARIRLLVEIARQATARPDINSGANGAGNGADHDGGFVDPRIPDGGAVPIDSRTLDEIEREAIEIDTLVGELLASARLEFQAFSPKPLDAVEVTRRAIERAGEDANKLMVASPRLTFSGDPTLVARALANLIDNARKHGAGLDSVDVRKRDEFIVFEITDRGPGFAPGDETRVFDRFYRGQQGSGEPGSHHGSLGLGLALVRRIAIAHGGSVAARSRPDGGAVVTLELAIDPPSVPPGSTDA